jgi:opacity protein-like surface antigen
MRFIATSLPRRRMVSFWVAGALLASASTVSAQGLGIGARLSWVTSDTEADVDAVRFTGGQLRLLAQRLGLEVAIDRRSESFDVRNEKVTETPIQASLLMRLASGSVSPYLLGGPGWYRRKVEPLDGADNLSLSSTEFGWHAGGGLEFIAGRHFGIHGDYRYTFLDFSDDEDEDEGFVGRLLPGHKGSMWTVGATFYF